MIILREKEFGFIQDVRRSGLGRTMKRNIGRLRTQVAKKYGDDVILENINKNKEYASKMRENILDNNPTLERNLLKYSHNNNTRVIGYDLGNKRNSVLGNIGGELNDYSSDIATGLIRQNKDWVSKYGAKSYFRYGRKIDNAISSGKNLVIHPSKSGSDLLAHELGHLKNQSSPGLGKVLDSSSTMIQSSNYGFSENGGLRDTTTGIIPGVKRYLKSRVILANERRASKNALEILKKNGASSEEIGKARENLLGNALGTYRTGANAYIRVPFKNLIQIPSRRGNKAMLKEQGRVIG